MAFGRITSGIFAGYNAARLLSPQMAHISERPRSEIVRAPFIHLGSRDTALEHRERIDSMGDDGGWHRVMNVHQFKFAPHAEVHPEVFDDLAVNLAHANLLHERRLAIPRRVFNTAVNARSAGMSDQGVQPIKDLLTRNIPVAYDNSVEVNPYWDMHDPRRLSVLVPAPHMNLVHPRKQKPLHPSPPLPMDYSMVTRPTQATESQRQQWDEKFEMSDPERRHKLKAIRWSDPDDWEDDDWS